MRALVLVATLASALAAACREPWSERCTAVCRTEAECAEALADPAIEVHRAECVRTCSELERTAAGKQLVTAHVACVGDAGADCVTLLACP
jgi:hypothetical protein